MRPRLYGGLASFAFLGTRADAEQPEELDGPRVIGTDTRGRTYELVIGPDGLAREVTRSGTFTYRWDPEARG